MTDVTDISKEESDEFYANLDKYLEEFQEIDQKRMEDRTQALGLVFAHAFTAADIYASGLATVADEEANAVLDMFVADIRNRFNTSLEFFRKEQESAHV